MNNVCKPVVDVVGGKSYQKKNETTVYRQIPADHWHFTYVGTYFFFFFTAMQFILFLKLKFSPSGYCDSLHLGSRFKFNLLRSIQVSSDIRVLRINTHIYILVGTYI